MLSANLSRFLGILTLLSLLAPQVADAALFSDIAGTPFAAAIETLGQEGVVHGYDDGLAHPNWPINRAEALKVLIAADPALALEADRMRLKMPALPLFSDIDQQAWYAPFVEVAFREGIAQGYPDSTLRPNRRLTSEEAVSLVLRAFNVQTAGSMYRTTDSAPNAPGMWFTEAWSTAVGAGMFLETPELRPGQFISRGYFFRLVVRARQMKPQQIAVQPVILPTVVETEPTVEVVPTLDPDVMTYASTKPFAISIPALNINDVTISHPEDLSSKGLLSVLQNGLGHLFSNPGEGGKVLIYGHSSGYPWDISQYTKVFRSINKLKPGEKIYLTYNSHLYVYQVSAKEVIDAKDNTVFEPDDKGEDLILYTCWPPDSIQNRYLVHATPVQHVALQ